jgi:hypothetical protein
MKLKSWNCTGISTKLNTPNFRQLLSDADILELQETFLLSTALQVGGFTPFILPARLPPGGKKHRALGGLVTLVSCQLASSFCASSCPALDFEGFENLLVRFARCDDSRDDLPSVFYVLNCYVVAQPASFDFSGLFLH